MHLHTQVLEKLGVQLQDYTFIDVLYSHALGAIEQQPALAQLTRALLSHPKAQV